MKSILLIGLGRFGRHIAKKLDELHHAFEAHEETVIGKGRHEQLHALLGKLRAKYPAG